MFVKVHLSNYLVVIIATDDCIDNVSFVAGNYVAQVGKKRSEGKKMILT